MKLIAIDMGGTTIKSALFDGNKIIKRYCLPTEPVRRKYDQLIPYIKGIINHYLKSDSDIEGVAFSVGTRVMNETDICWGNNEKIRHYDNFVKSLKKIGIKLPITLINDGKSACLAEAKKGKYKGVHALATVVIGTAIGGGFIIGNEIINGKWAAGAELSLPVVRTKNNRPIKAGHACGLRPTLKFAEQKIGKPLTGEELFEMFDKKIEPAFSIVNEWFDSVAILLHNTLYFYGPDVLLLAGGITSRPNLIEDIKKRMYLIKNESLDMAIIDIATFKGDAGLIGAITNFEMKYKENKCK